ncbi:MAG TPA: hypothetical protein VML75_10215 [Kofleriaceae bacterium]|nr:hypothetical protein [Kofleriaceae bacterium]
MATVVRAVAVTLAVGALSVWVGACKKPKTWGEPEVDRGLVEVDSAHQHLRSDVIGQGEFESRATFVLVDARNSHDEDLLVTLGGELVDGNGAVVGTLRPESLRVPAGLKRTFALIDDQNAERPGATSARVQVNGANVPSYAPSIGVDEIHVYEEGDHLLASARIANKAERPAKVIVLSSFRDEKGMPITRPFMLIELDGGTSRPVDFRGPPGATSATIFVGDTVW